MYHLLQRLERLYHVMQFADVFHMSVAKIPIIFLHSSKQLAFRMLTNLVLCELRTKFYMH